MANSDIFAVTTTWARVQVNGGDLTNGTFSMESLSHNRVDFQKKLAAEAAPTASEGGHFSLRIDGASVKVDFLGTEVLYAKHSGSAVTSNIGIIPA